MYDPKFTQKQMYDQYGRSRSSSKKVDPKPSRSSGFSGMGADPAERFGGSPTKGLGSKPFEQGSTYDVIPTPPQRDDRRDPPTSIIDTVKNKAVELFKSFGGDDPKDTEVDPSKVYRGPMFRGPINPGVIEARIKDAVDYSKAPPLFYTAFGSTYDTVPPVTANKDRVKNAVNDFLKQRGLGGKEYTIKRGDTLSEIAQREGVAIDDLAKINKIENINRILAGETLIIPPPQEVENVKDFVDSVDPDAQFSQSGVPMDQRIFEPELGYDEIPLPSQATVDKKIAGLGARPEVTVTELDPPATGFEGMGPDPSTGQSIMSPEYNTVEKAQKRLNDLGYTTLLGPLVVDGDLGRGTARQLRKFQATAGIPITGELDEATQKALKKNSNRNKEGKDPNAELTTLSEGLFQQIKKPIAEIESGGESEPYAAVGGDADDYDGKYQFGWRAKEDLRNNPAITDAERAKLFHVEGELNENDPSRVAFRADANLQEKAFRLYVNQNHDTLTRNSAKYRAMDDKNKLAVLGYAHNQGAENALEWLTTTVSGTDAFGTRGDEYSDAVVEELSQRKKGK